MGEAAEAGLSSRQAAVLLSKYGPNELPAAGGPSAVRQVVAQLVHFFALMLWVAAGLAVAAGMPQLGAAIAAVVVLNAAFAFIQEHRAERAAAKLRDMLPIRARVVRDGRPLVVPGREVVPGDVVLLSEGDRIPADLVCLRAQNLMVDTSTMTGESVPESVGAGEQLAAGTFVVGGRGSGRATATGAGTRFAAIAALSVVAHRPRTPLENDIRVLVRTVAAVAAGVGAVFFAVMLLLGAPPADGFIFGVGVTVALVPEGLLPTVTLSLAIGAQRMAGQRALVRRLASVETLGSTTVICTDKTGTLTRNQMLIASIWTPGGATGVDAGDASAPLLPTSAAAAAEAVALVAAARRCSKGSADRVASMWSRHGDPMESAIDILRQRLGLGSDDEADEVAFWPFDPQRRMTVSVRTGEVLVKGAPEAVLAACAQVPDTAHRHLRTMLAAGLRVLAVARGAGPSESNPQVPDPPTGLTLLGLLGFEDPPREGVAEAIGQCRRAGIALIMITGDHPDTAAAIAAQVGLSRPGAPVLVDSQLPGDDAALGAAIDCDGTVLARITPADKLRIARALRARGHIVAMTGDGVNDAPALREADIGVAMGASGTDVAREAADLVLLDDHFGTIVAAVRQGRSTFLNARRFLTYHLTDNVAELAPFVAWAVTGGSFPLALGVLQILALDLGTDTLPAIALGAQRAGDRVLDHPPVHGRLLDRTVAVRAFGVLGPLEAGAGLLVFVCSFLLVGWRPGAPFPSGGGLAAASGATFLTVVAMQCANTLACRSTGVPGWRRGLDGNRLLVPALVFAAGFGLACVAVPPVARLLGQAPPLAGIVPAIAVAPLVLLVGDAAWKAVRSSRRQARRVPDPAGSDS